MKREDTIRIKRDSHDPKLNGSGRARADRKAVKKFKSPDVSKMEYSHYDPRKKLWILSDRKGTFDNMKDNFLD